MYSNKPLCKNAERFLLFEIDIKKDLWYSITSKFFGCIKVSKNLLSSCSDFKAVIEIIENAKSWTLKAVNAGLINTYWELGKYISDLCIEASFGDKVIDEIAAYISDAAPAIKGFNRRSLYRMKQFYETYKDDEFVSAVLTQLSHPCKFRKIASFYTIHAY